MFPCWNQVLQILFPTIFNLLHHQYSLMVNLNTKSQKSLIPNWTTNATYVSSFTWSGSLAMKVLMMKPLDYLRTNLHMLPTLYLTSMSNIHPNLVPFLSSQSFCPLFFIFHPFHIILQFCFHSQKFPSIFLCQFLYSLIFLFLLIFLSFPFLQFPFHFS